MIDAVLEFTSALREAGIPVGISESVDAFKAMGYVELDDREELRSALAATMVKSELQRPAFDTLFDLYFSPGRERGLYEGEPEAPEVEGTDEEFIRQLVQGLGAGSGGMREMARRAIDRFGYVPNSPTQTRFFEYPVWRALDPDELLRRMFAEVEDEGMGALDRRLLEDEFRRRLGAFRSEVGAEVRARSVQQKGPESVAKHSVRPLPEDLNFGSATAAEISELKRAIRPLARKLATRLAMKRRRSSRGGLDVRRTVRHSLSTGGVPFEPQFRHRAPHRPELFVLCDVSGSVAAFARFSLMLVHALSSQFTRVRSFVFVDTLDEVTKLFEHEDFVVAVDRVNQEAEVVSFDGHSDYGSALEVFWERYGRDVTSKATVLLLGDARNNYRVPKSWVLEELRHKAHKVYWLNPERKDYWDSDDSIASEYARHTDGMIEVRNLKQLEEFVATNL